MSSDGLSLDIVPRPNSLPSWVLATFREDAMGLLCQNAPIHEWDEADRWRVEAWYDCLSEDNVEAATNLAAQYPRAVTGSFFQGVGAIPTVCVACLLGSVKVVEYLLRLQPSLASSPYEKLFSTPPTHFASTSDSARVLGLLLSNLPPTAATCINGNGDSILHMACESGATDIVAFLVKFLLTKHRSKAALSQVVLGLNSRSLSPLHVGIIQGNSACVEVLLSSIPRSLARECANQAGLSSLTPLHLCAMGGDRKVMLDIAKFVLEKGGDAGVHSNSLPSTPLHFACREGFARLAGVLLKSSAPPNAKDGLGRTCLHVAAQRGHTLCAMISVQEGADVTVRDDRGRSALHTAAGEIGGGECLLYLLAVGPKMKNSVDSNGVTPLLEAVEDGNLEKVKILLRAGANVTKGAISKARECLVRSYLETVGDVGTLTAIVRVVEGTTKGICHDNFEHFGRHEQETAELLNQGMVKIAGKKGGNAIASRILGFVGRRWIAEESNGSKGVTTAMALSSTLKRTAECLGGDTDGSSDDEGVNIDPLFEEPAPRKAGKRRKELKEFVMVKNRFGM